MDLAYYVSELTSGRLAIGPFCAAVLQEHRTEEAATWLAELADRNPAARDALHRLRPCVNLV